MKIVIASDSFKGSLTSAEVAAAASAGIRSIDPDAEIVEICVADGGEGTAESIIRALGAQRRECRVDDPLHRTITASYGVADTASGSLAIIDMASASGLTLLKDNERDVMSTDTYGTGQLIARAYDEGCRKFIIGLGGSATCDGGAGMLAALGVVFCNISDESFIPSAGTLGEISSISFSPEFENYKDCSFTVICDVDNPLCGPKGAAHIFAPQKGASPDEVEEIERGMISYSKLLSGIAGRDVASLAGAGAAGGLGAAFTALFNAVLTPGVDAVLDCVGFDEAVAGADLVVTGEGHIDSQTLFGKLPIGVCRRARRAGVETLVIAGKADDIPQLLKAGFSTIIPIHLKPLPLEEAMRPEIASKAVALSIANYLTGRISIQ